jgi:hypothetical protein
MKGRSRKTCTSHAMDGVFGTCRSFRTSRTSPLTAWQRSAGAVSSLGRVAVATREASGMSGFISGFFRAGCDCQLDERCFADGLDPPEGGTIDRIAAGCRRRAGCSRGADGSYRELRSSCRRAGGSLCRGCSPECDRGLALWGLTLRCRSAAAVRPRFRPGFPRWPYQPYPRPRRCTEARQIACFPTCLCGPWWRCATRRCVPRQTKRLLFQRRDHPCHPYPPVEGR